MGNRSLHALTGMNTACTHRNIRCIHHYANRMALAVMFHPPCSKKFLQQEFQYVMLRIATVKKKVLYSTLNLSQSYFIPLTILPLLNRQRATIISVGEFTFEKGKVIKGCPQKHPCKLCTFYLSCCYKMPLQHKETRKRKRINFQGGGEGEGEADLGTDKGNG